MSTVLICDTFQSQVSLLGAHIFKLIGKTVDQPSTCDISSEIFSSRSTASGAQTHFASLEGS